MKGGRDSSKTEAYGESWNIYLISSIKVLSLCIKVLPSSCIKAPFSKSNTYTRDPTINNNNQGAQPELHRVVNKREWFEEGEGVQYLLPSTVSYSHSLQLVFICELIQVDTQMRCRRRDESEMHWWSIQHVSLTQAIEAWIHEQEFIVCIAIMSCIFKIFMHIFYLLQMQPLRQFQQKHVLFHHLSSAHKLHRQPQRDMDLTHQMLLLFILPSYGYHINEEALWKRSNFFS